MDGEDEPRGRYGGDLQVASLGAVPTGKTPGSCMMALMESR